MLANRCSNAYKESFVGSSFEKMSVEIKTRRLLRDFAHVAVMLLLGCASGTSHAMVPRQSDADTLVQQLRNLPTPLPASLRSDGSIRAEEQQRRRLYEGLLRLGPPAVLALSRALADDDVHLRRNAALAFGALAGGWYDRSWPKLDIRSALTALVEALQDDDSSVRAWSAQAIGDIGPDAAKAVPDLIKLLANSDEGSRNSACIALRFIGPAAKQALPALRQALSDPSKDVRGFAALAIESIDR
jgi:HEAT repeat protein